MAEEQIVDAEKLSKIFEVTERYIRQLAKEGHIPKTGRGLYPLWRCVQGYIRYLKSRITGNNQHKAETPAEAREAEELRKISEQADKVALDNAERRKELLPLDDVTDFFNEVAVIYGTQLDALAGRLAGQLPGDPGANRQIIFAEARAIRAATADRLLAEAERLTEERRVARERPASEDSGSVGGREQGAAKGKRGAGTVAE